MLGIPPPPSQTQVWLLVTVTLATGQLSSRSDHLLLRFEGQLLKQRVTTRRNYLPVSTASQCEAQMSLFFWQCCLLHMTYIRLTPSQAQHLFTKMLFVALVRDQFMGWLAVSFSVSCVQIPEYF